MLTNLILSLVLASNNLVPFNEVGYTPYTQDNPIFTNQIITKKEKSILFNGSETLLVNSIGLIYKDMFDVTRKFINTQAPNIYRYKNTPTINIAIYTNLVNPYYQKSDNGKEILTDRYYTTNYYTNYSYKKTKIFDGTYLSEKNPIAKIFFDNNLWEPTFLLTAFLNYQAVNILNNLDNTGISSYIYTLILTSAEIWAIDTWAQWEILPKDFSYTANLFAIQF